MPDIQTALKSALSKTLQQWDDDEEAPPPAPAQPVSTSSQPTQPTQGIPMTKAFHVTNNVSRATFEYIKDNPGSTRKEIIKALEHQNFSQGSVSSLIAQMVRNKMAHATNDLYYADVPEYRPLKSLKAIKKMEGQAPATKRKYTKKDTTGIGALLRAKIEAAPAPAQHEDQTPPIVVTRKGFVSLVRNRTPESIVDNMTVYQARELYLHLKTLFGN
jgi:hypothetical protein